jgi:transcriptional regulator with XRE-family HTH domain
MLKARSESEIMAEKVVYALGKSELTDAEVARECGVSKQAVNGWRKTGRISKGNLKSLADLTGFPLAWWADPAAPIEGREPHRDGDRSRDAKPTIKAVPGWPFDEKLHQRFRHLTKDQQRDVEEALDDHVSRLERKRQLPRKSKAA